MSTATATRSETFNRTVKAKAIAEVLDWTLTDARIATENEWVHGAKFAHVPAPSLATRAAATALMDVQQGRYRESATGAGPERIAYNTVRRAALIAEAFATAGLEAGQNPTEEQWDIAGRLASVTAGVRPNPDVSQSVRDAVQALRA